MKSLKPQHNTIRPQILYHCVIFIASQPRWGRRVHLTSSWRNNVF